MPESQLLATSNSYEASALSIATGISALAILLLGISVLVRDRKSRAAHCFALLAFTAAGWQLCFALMYAATHPGVALTWARFGQFLASLAAAAVFQFAIESTGRQRRLQLLAWGFWFVAIVVGILTAATKFMVPAVRLHSWGYYPFAPALHGATVVPAAVMTLAAIHVFWRAYRTTEGKARDRAAGMLLAFATGSLAFFDYVAVIGVDMQPVGFFACLVFTAIAANAIGRYDLADLTPEYAAAQILETMKGAVIVVDMEGRIRVINRAASNMLGYRGGDLAGEHIRAILEPSSQLTTGQLLNSMGVLEHTMVWRSADGARIDVLAASSFVRGSDGTPVGVVYVASDITERKRAEEALRESEHRYRTLFDENPLPMYVYEVDTLRIVEVNAAAVRHYGYTRGELLSMTIAAIRPAEDVAAVVAAIPSLGDRHGPQEYRHQKKNGTIIDVEVTSFEFLSGGRRSRLVIAQDVTERRRAEEDLRESQQRYRELFERNLAGVYRTTPAGRILDCNDACARVFGFDTREQLLGSDAPAFYFDAAERERLVAKLREQKTVTNQELRLRRADGTEVWVLENINLLAGRTPDDDVLEGTIIDITDRRRAQEQIEYQAYHDNLTGLPNRLLFRDRLSVALAQARRHSRAVAVMFLDLDQFKLVNDTLGHTVGDRLLQAIGARLVKCVRAEDTVARMGGDEFTVLITDLQDRHATGVVAQKILDAVRQAVVLDEHELFVTTSIGIALFPDEGEDAETLLKNADRAMYRAKELGRDNYQYAIPARFDTRLLVERNLHRALERKEFVVHYQPMVEIATGRVVGAEALVRWQHPEQGLVMPDEFIPAAEGSQLIVALGEWVLRTACRQMKIWHDAGHDWLRVAVNLSPRQYARPELPSVVESVLAETGFPARYLDLEITESAAMQNAELSLTILSRLKEMGIRISIDDFGTGYSSLSYLKRFPIDTVKIDQDFVRDLTADANDTAIISAVISMARALGLRVIAEGVETEEQLAFLRREQCAEMQGFLYSRPLPAEEFERALTAAPPLATTPRLHI